MFRQIITHLRHAGVPLCAFLLLVVAVGPGALRAEQLGCDYECLLKQTAVQAVSCCDKSAAAQGGSHDCGESQSNHRNILPVCCEGGACFDTPLEIQETAAVSKRLIEPENAQAIARLIYSTALLDQLWSGHFETRHVLPGPAIPIYLRTCVFLI